jgi:PHS family inorganic phosphate transporter-like MFS transporter
MASPLRSHLGFLTVIGVGLFSDGYLNITIGLIVPMLGYIYFQDEKNKVPTVSSDVIKSSLPLGMIVGQLLFGVFGDALGRHIVYGKELIITIFGTLMVVLLPWHGLSHNGVVAWVSVFRVVAGLGTGGDYPMTSTLCTEHIRFGSRAKRVRTIFSCIGLGATSAGIVFVVLLAAFKDSIIGNVARLEWARRLLLGLGMIPAAFTLQARLTSKETEPYQEYVATETGLTAGSGRGLKDQFRDFRVYFSEWKHAKVLFGTYACWFLL